MAAKHTEDTYAEGRFKELIDVEAIRIIIGKNLKKLVEATGWKQSTFAEETGTSETSLSKYINHKDLKGLQPLEYLLGICEMEQLKEMGLHLTIEMLISDKFDPVGMIAKKQNSPTTARMEMVHGDFLGNYLCYFFDQGKETDVRDPKAARALRYGLISVYNDYDSMSGGDATTKVTAGFFNASEWPRVLTLKKKLDHIFKSNASVDNRNRSIAEIFAAEQNFSYEGAVTFSNRHTFIHMNSRPHGDQALILLYSPHKKTTDEYIGGLGSVVSVAWGREHMPTAQKIILSKRCLDCDDEVIADRLGMSSAHIAQTAEAEEICRFCSALYAPDSLLKDLDEADKLVMIQRRLDQMVRHYVEKNLCCVGNISEDEDEAVYRLIAKSAESS